VNGPNTGVESEHRLYSIVGIHQNLHAGKPRRDFTAVLARAIADNEPLVADSKLKKFVKPMMRKAQKILNIRSDYARKNLENQNIF